MPWQPSYSQLLARPLRPELNAELKRTGCKKGERGLSFSVLLPTMGCLIQKSNRCIMGIRSSSKCSVVQSLTMSLSHRGGLYNKNIQVSRLQTQRPIDAFVLRTGLAWTHGREGCGMQDRSSMALAYINVFVVTASSAFSVISGTCCRDRKPCEHFIKSVAHSLSEFSSLSNLDKIRPPFFFLIYKCRGCPCSAILVLHGCLSFPHYLVSRIIHEQTCFFLRYI